MVKSYVGRLGGIARNRLHGNPGTPEGRRLGGLRSQVTHAKHSTGFNVLRPVLKPRKSISLAECMGILAGDGHLGAYQVSVVTNSITDFEHATYVAELLMRLFIVPVSITKRRDANALIILVSSKNVSRIIQSFGMPIGNKVANQIAPPLWIYSRKIFQTAYLKGLIDTDGSVYFDTHTRGKKLYSSTCIAFTNASVPLLNFVYDTWQMLGYTPTRSGRSIRLRRKIDVYDYARTIGFSNPKHLRKIKL